MQTANQPVVYTHLTKYLSSRQHKIHSLTQSFIPTFSTLPLNYQSTHPAIQPDSQSIGRTANKPSGCYSI